MKKFLVLATILFLFATYTNAVSPKTIPSSQANSAQKQVKKQHFSGKITGYQTAEHWFSVRKGESISIRMKANNPNTYFNVWAPKGNEAVFNGSFQGEKFDGIATKTGKYRVQVYFMRAHARRHATTNYSLNITTSMTP